MLTILGYTLIGATFVGLSYPAFESIFLKERYKKRKLKENLYKAFVNADLYKEHGEQKEYPFILKFDQNKKRITFVFNIPKGLNPEKFKDALFVFKQHFGMYISLDVDEKQGVLNVYNEGLPTKFKYNYNEIKETIKGLRVPILAGINLEGELYCFDLVKNPHILIAGETGSGKSSHIRSLLTTLIKTKKPNQLRLVLGDLKRSEFHLFKQIKHVEGVYHSAEELRPALNKVKREMTKRGDLLDGEGVNSIDELTKKLPYIIVCIDEVILLKKEKDIMDILEEISSIGRSLGVFVILSLQRPDSKLLDGKLKVNLTVRMAFKTADKTNSKIIGVEGAENIKNEGRMILKINSESKEIQSPLLENETAKLLLESYKEKQTAPKLEPEESDYSKVVQLLHE